MSDAAAWRDANRKVDDAFARHKQGDLRHAYAAYSKVLAKFPEHALALHYLGLIAQQTGRPHETINLLQRSIRSNGTDARAYNHLGQVYIGLKDYDTAVTCFDRALAIDPLHVDSVNNLANVIRIREPDRAVELYRRALAIDPASANTAYNLACMFLDDNQHQEAMELLDEVVEIEPRHYQAHYELGALHEKLGDFERAIRHYAAVRKLKAQHAGSLANLLALPSYEPNPRNVRDAEKLLADGKLTEEHRIKLHYGLGKHYDRAGRYDKAFAHFCASKQLVREQQAPFNLAHVSAQFDRAIEAFSEENLKSLPQGHDSDRPVFIVGLPRSGTTLTEQILASHPAVTGAGELPALPRIIKQLRPGYPFNIMDLDGPRLTELAAEYLGKLEASASPGARHIVDKMPTNFMHLGTIAVLFPRARIIHCRRDPLDTGLSCMSELFAMTNDYTTSFDDFAGYFLHCERLMAHWRETLRLQIHEQRYEDLVTNPERGARSLIEFCGLEWDEACLRFQQADRLVATPSRWQVRQPIYRTSVGRWRNYAAYIEPLRQTLLDQGYRYELW